MKLHNITTSQKTKPSIRKGQGNGSGHGNFSGRGCKGQLARSGKGKLRIGFEGGQSTLLKKLPKLGGFTNINHIDAYTLTFDKLTKYYSDGDTVSMDTLKELRIIPKTCKKAKIVSTGDITIKLTISSDIAVSEGAKEVILKAGGSL